MLKREAPRVFVLNDKGEPEEVQSFLAWSSWMARHPDLIRVQLSRFFCQAHGEVELSTVFLGLDTSLSRTKTEEPPPPIIWECKSFGLEAVHGHEFETRCGGNWHRAKAMHERSLSVLAKELDIDPSTVTHEFAKYWETLLPVRPPNEGPRRRKMHF